MHTLKQRMQDAEEEHKRNIQVRKECLAVLTEALQTVELNEMGRVQGDMEREVAGAREQQQVEMSRLQDKVKGEMVLMQEQLKEYALLQESLQTEMAGVRARHRQVLVDREDGDRIRAEVGESLRQVLMRVEVRGVNSQERDRAVEQSAQAVAIAQLNETISALNEKNKELLLQEESLRGDLDHYRQQLSEATSTSDDTMRLLQSRCDEQLQAISKQKEANDTLKAELKKRVAAMHAVKKDAIFSGTIMIMMDTSSDCCVPLPPLSRLIGSKCTSIVSVIL